jgi:hypothetical protein
VSNRAMTWAIDAKVEKSHKLVLMLLADAHNGHTDQCFPSHEWIMEHGGLGESTVAACLKDLEKWGFIERDTQRLGRGKGSRTNFVLNFHILVEKKEHQNLELYNSGLRTLESEDLEHQNLSVHYKEEPEYEPEITGTGAEKEVFDFYNLKAEAVGWTKHSKLTDAIRKSVSARIKEYGSDGVKAFIEALTQERWTYQGFSANPDFRASLVYICRPKTFAEKFDKLVTDRRKPDLLDSPDTYNGVSREAWEMAINWYIASGGGWDLGHHSAAPHLDGCKAPQDLLEKAKAVSDKIRMTVGVDG